MQSLLQPSFQFPLRNDDLLTFKAVSLKTISLNWIILQKNNLGTSEISCLIKYCDIKTILSRLNPPDPLVIRLGLTNVLKLLLMYNELSKNWVYKTRTLETFKHLPGKLF